MKSQFIPTLLCCVFTLLFESASLQLTPWFDCFDYSTILDVRVFHDLSDLQNNTLPFFYKSEGYIGNSVVFSKKKIEVIPKDAFKTYNSESIRSILLNGKRVRDIEDGAFNFLGCAMILDLQNNNVSSVRKDMFGGIRFLRVLDLSDNVLEEIPERVFTFVSRLRKLSLARNKLWGLKPHSFAKLWLLEDLDLSGNCIKRLPGLMLQYFKSLIVLQLGSNHMESIHLQYWSAGTYLKLLNLSHNALTTFDLSLPYNFRLLTRLYLNDNKIRNMRLRDFNLYLPYLEFVDINDNLWSCRELLKIIKSLRASHVSMAPGNINSLPNINMIVCDKPIILKWNKTRSLTPDSIRKYKLTNMTWPPLGDEDNFEFPERVTQLEMFFLCVLGLGFTVTCCYLTLITHCCTFTNRRRGYSPIDSPSTMSSSVSYAE